MIRVASIMRRRFVIALGFVGLVLQPTGCAGDFTWSSSGDGGTFFGSGPIAKLFEHTGTDGGAASGVEQRRDGDAIVSDAAAGASNVGASDASEFAGDGSAAAAAVTDDDVDAGPSADASSGGPSDENDAGLTTDCVTDNGGCDVLTVCNGIAPTHSCSACPAGYSGNGVAGCSDIDECATNNGACARSTSCTNTPGGHVCGDCPSGFVRSGQAACAPTLLGLGVSAGMLAQALSAGTTEYSVDVPLAQADISFTPTLPDGVSARIGTAVLASGQAWTSEALSLGDNPIAVEVSAPGAISRSYTVHVRRARQEAYLKASNTGTEDLFGTSVAIAADTLVIGAPGEASRANGIDSSTIWQGDDAAANSGAAYVFVRSAGSWSQEAYLKASDSQAGAGFGASVAIAGDTVVIGAPGAGSDAAPDAAVGSAAVSGAAYVFVRSAGVWSQAAALRPEPGTAGSLAQQFGTRVAIAGDTLAVSELAAAPSPTSRRLASTLPPSANGAVQVFARSGTNWQAQMLLAADGGENAPSFGLSLAMTSELIVVGSPAEAGATDAVYVFEPSGTDWVERARLSSATDQLGENFACSVGVFGDRIVVGAAGETAAVSGMALGSSAASQPASGAAYVFVRDGESWNEEAYLKADNAEAGDAFGTSVAISGDNLVVGAPVEAGAGLGIDPTDPGRSDDSASRAGAVYMFTRSAAGWVENGYIKASNTDAGDRFGSALAITDETLAIGALNESSAATGVDASSAAQADNSAPWSGAVYVFH
jgi:hypothetical protein